MANKYLAREDAPFGATVWEILDTAMVEAAKSELTGRRLLEIEGPHGYGLKAIPLRDVETEDGLIVSESLPLQLIQKSFALGARDLANYEREEISLGKKIVRETAIACAKMEDEIVFHGVEGTPGLLTAKDVNEDALSTWDEPGMAANDLIDAVTLLDEAGYHGPYTLALSPGRYNRLLRMYPRGRQTELEHLQMMVTDGIYKAPVLESEGVLMASGRQYASIVLGQDMTVGFIGPEEGAKVAFSISESVALRIRQPRSICVLT
ncbi:MAG: family 1 encapsulin nanocompartment shell protein [Anaerolineae bacterium]